ncbi:hypothetical protein [Enterococcus sp. AZ109]|uniref:hypothetical protein n=1 Tax=Enterococcus sp. AZ109 TaxID=2774634 RepID=UPI003F263E1F
MWGKVLSGSFVLTVLLVLTGCSGAASVDDYVGISEKHWEEKDLADTKAIAGKYYLANESISYSSIVDSAQAQAHEAVLTVTEDGKFTLFTIDTPADGAQEPQLFYADEDAQFHILPYPGSKLQSGIVATEQGEEVFYSYTELEDVVDPTPYRNYALNPFLRFEPSLYNPQEFSYSGTDTGITLKDGTLYYEGKTMAEVPADKQDIYEYADYSTYEFVTDYANVAFEGALEDEPLYYNGFIQFAQSLKPSTAIFQNVEDVGAYEKLSAADIKEGFTKENELVEPVFILGKRSEAGIVEDAVCYDGEQFYVAEKIDEGDTIGWNRIEPYVRDPYGVAD